MSASLCTQLPPPWSRLSARPAGARADNPLASQQQALNQFLAEVERRAFVIARAATRNADTALDIVQDAMLGFVRRYQHKPNAEWAPLFFTVLNSRIMDWHRRQGVRRRWKLPALLGRRGTGEGGGEDQDLIASAPDHQGVQPDRALHSDASGDAIRAAVEQLPPRQRQAFMLRTWQGLSVAETAAAMDCSQGSVKTHLSRAMHQLRESLEDFAP